jgi:uncharacterized NAD(P)/FAD-binding protein YdhS
MVEVGIIGLGPWGLCTLERFIDAGRRVQGTDISVHIVEPSAPGGGLYSQTGPDYLILNTPCGQHSLYPYPESVGEGKRGKGFYEWAVERGYRWHGHECRISTTGQAISPSDFLPRRLMGEYLEWFYEVLVSEAPENVRVTHHRTGAFDVEATADGRERVYLDNGVALELDHVILTLGNANSPSAVSPESTTYPYPVERYISKVHPRQKVAIEGMGLVALDVVAALSVGLGGRFTTEKNGKLRYHPSGREPILYLYSRTGHPHCAKSISSSDPFGRYQPAICTPEAVARLRQLDGSGPGRTIDARKELLPLVFAEMELRYYTQAAQLDEGLELAQQVRERLVSAWHQGKFSEACSIWATAYGRFSAADHFFAGEGTSTFLDAKEYESQVYNDLKADVDEAIIPGGVSPVKAALETLRALRDTLRLAVEFKGLSLSSYLDFQSNLRSRFTRLVAGPPVFRSQQLLALIDADVVRLPFGPAPEVRATRRGVVVRSRHLERPCAVTFDWLIRGHIDSSGVGNSTSPLLVNMARSGRLQPLTIEGSPVDSIELSRDFHPVNVDGQVEERVWAFGPFTEGVRYFTLYIPSPKSRVRAFVDAEICANQIVGANQMAGDGA